MSEVDSPVTPPSSSKATNLFSILAIVFGGVSVLLFPIIFGPVGVILAAVAFSKKERLAGVGLAVSIVGTLVGFWLGWVITESMLTSY